MTCTQILTKQLRTANKNQTRNLKLNPKIPKK